MKIDFGAALYDLDKNPIKQTTNAESPDATLGFVCAIGLMKVEEIDKKVTAYRLMQLAHDGATVDLTPEEVVLLKKSIEDTPPLIYGQCVALLNG